jgi:hypothetical protein
VILTLRLAAFTAALVMTAGTASAGGAPRSTSAQAERNLLGAVRILRRWNLGITDRRTGLVPKNTTAKCQGRGNALGGRYTLFTCVIRRGALRVRVLYVTLPRSGFELLSHHLVHPG